MRIVRGVWVTKRLSLTLTLSQREREIVVPVKCGRSSCRVGSKRGLAHHHNQSPLRGRFHSSPGFQSWARSLDPRVRGDDIQGTPKNGSRDSGGIRGIEPAPHTSTDRIRSRKGMG